MNIFSLPAIVSFTINFSIALIVLLDQSNRSLNRWFSAFIFNFALWNLAEILLLNSHNRETALFAAQILYRVIFLAPAFFLIIAYQFPKNIHPYSRKPYFPVLIFAIPIILLIFSFPHFQIKLIQLSRTPDVYYYQFSFAFSIPFLLLIFTFLGYIIWGSLILIYKIPHLRTSRQKNQTRILLIGVLSIFIFLVFINTIRPILSSIFMYYVLSSILVIVISVFFLLAIVQFHFFKISRLISGGITYTVLTSFILAIYFLVVKSLSDSLIHYLGFNSFAWEALLVLFLIMIIRPLEGRIQMAVDRLLYRDIHTYRKHFLKFSRDMLSYLELPEFFAQVEKFLKKEFQLPAAYIFIKNQHGNELRLQSGNPSPIVLPVDSYLEKRLLSARRAVEIGDLPGEKLNPDMRRFVEEHNIQLIVPLILEERLAGIILLPQRHLQKEYPEEIQEILTIFANEVTTVYHRNQIIEKIRQEERERLRLQHLAALGQLTAGVAHEIRNPLNTISTAAETLLNRNLSSEDATELQQFILEEANRLNLILTDFLNLSRLKEPHIEPVDIGAVLDKTISSLQNRGIPDISITMHISPDIPVIETDSDLLYQALLNLGINALEAVESRCQQDDSFNCTEGKVVFTVSSNTETLWLKIQDNGIGIPENSKQQIFEPFFTTKEKGTGLGLSITHNIIQALHGRIQVESQPGNTQFVIQLPIKWQVNENGNE